MSYMIMSNFMLVFKEQANKMIYEPYLEKVDNNDNSVDSITPVLHNEKAYLVPQVYHKI